MKVAAKALARHFKSMDALGLGIVGGHVADQRNRCGDSRERDPLFANEANRDLVRRLREKGVRMELSDEELSSHSDKLSGQSIVVSGVFSLHSRDEYKA